MGHCSSSLFLLGVTPLPGRWGKLVWFLQLDALPPYGTTIQYGAVYHGTCIRGVALYPVKLNSPQLNMSNIVTKVTLFFSVRQGVLLSMSTPVLYFLTPPHRRRMEGKNLTSAGSELEKLRRVVMNFPARQHLVPHFNYSATTPLHCLFNNITKWFAGNQWREMYFYHFAERWILYLSHMTVVTSLHWSLSNVISN